MRGEPRDGIWLTVDIDAVRVDFDPGQIVVLNAILAFIMFGVSLDLRPPDFLDLARSPRAPLVGLVAQFVLLPAMTFALTTVLPLPDSLKLGMIMVAACPGGTVSNFMTHLAGGRLATSVGMTAVSSTAALVTVPLNLAFWGGLQSGTAQLVDAVQLDAADVMRTVLVVLVVPVAAGMLVGTQFPRLAQGARTPVRILSLLFLCVLVVAATRKNLGLLLQIAHLIIYPVVLMNALAFLLGWSSARAFDLDAKDQRAVTLEVGIQNSGLGLALALQFFNSVGGVAAICAFWGIWHLLGGLALASFWSRWPVPSEGTA
ncbi:MAG: bile acid:sodium symporter family protein [Myxococcota bacterium]